MLNKIFSHGSGGSKGVMDYMLKEKDKITTREGMTVLRGDVELQAQLIDSLIPNQKQHYVSGCWSFEESPDQVTEAQKNEIMDGTESLMLAGLDPDRISITWIEHTDKGRLELNYIVACVDLEHGRVFQPYVHSHDKDRWNAFRDIQNIKHGFSEPDDPAKARTFSQTDNLPRTTKQLKEDITAELESQVVAGLITNRDDVKQALNELGFEITRSGKNSISIKNPDPKGRNIKFQSTNEGGLYDIKFNASTEAASEISRSSEDFRRRAGERIEEAQRVFERELKHKSDYHDQRHGKPMRESRGLEREVDRSFIRNEQSNSESFERLSRDNEQSVIRRPERVGNNAARTQNRSSNNAARTQREHQHNHQHSVAPLFHISPDSSSVDIDTGNIYRNIVSEDTLKTTFELSELAHEQTDTRSSQQSDASTARHDSASSTDARSERSRYSIIDSIIDRISTDANTASKRVARVTTEIKYANRATTRATSKLVANTDENTRHSSDFDESIIVNTRESDDITRYNEELSTQITEIGSLDDRNTELRERIRSVKCSADSDQQRTTKIRQDIKPKADIDSMLNTKREHLSRSSSFDNGFAESFNKPREESKVETPFTPPTPFNTPRRP